MGAVSRRRLPARHISSRLEAKFEALGLLFQRKEMVPLQGFEETGCMTRFVRIRTTLSLSKTLQVIGDPDAGR